MRLPVLLLFASLLQAQSIALSFDDGPAPGQKVALDAAGKNRAILAALEAAKVPSVLFVAGSRCLDDPAGRALVRAWGEAGHRIANHSYAHAYFHAKKATLEAFEADFEKNDALIRGLPGYAKWFRFPYLKEGDTAAKRDGARAFLKARGYRNGHVTIDASDWYYDQRLHARLAREPAADLAPYRRAYLDHLRDRAAYYDGLARRVLGRDVRHVLLLHHNLINALFLPDVIGMFRDLGWTFISPAEAYADPAYALEPGVLPAGESLVWSLAKEKGVQDLRSPGEDGAYEQPKLDALGL
ncbi:polysaccharide deacetylase family protein [Geothrix sp. 21YS21S-2]|uniref:polysaccharide deacetylase family protein n=1 Tax=Geothrix sp. 21YS21S-2 TaxID=3068893 RepID=UPI0027BAE0B7|nr:polysaccharide deacetylase family protein [Geothrix sp. 21YS21S-2]